MFKMAQNTLSSWAITGLTIILLLGAIYQVYTWGSAATTKRSGHTVVVVVQVQMQNGTGLKKRVFSVSFLLGGFAGLLACLRNNSDKDMSRLSSSFLVAWPHGWLIIIEGQCSCSCSPWSSSTKHRPALINQHSDQGKGPWKRKMKMNPAGQARSGQVMLYSAPCCTRHLLVCLLFALFLLLPVYRVCTLTLVYGRYDANYVLCTPYSSAYACMCVYRYLNWTGN